MLVANWANVFIFDLFNQRPPESVREDSFNKPWRPLPQGQLTSAQAGRLLYAAIPAVLGLSACLGIGIESTIALVLSWAYCDLKGGDKLTRDPLISLGYSVAFVGSLRLGLSDPNVSLSASGYRWLGMMMGVIVTTMQVQDLKDQIGDQARGRQTWPLVVGHRVSRWWIAAWLLFWSVACSLFWRLPAWAAAVPLAVGLCVAGSVLAQTNDARAWRLWCVWQVALYSCPVVAQLLGLIST
jgi:4-hydroxybenzoate polyprenyltransferase